MKTYPNFVTLARGLKERGSADSQGSPLDHAGLEATLEDAKYFQLDIDIVRLLNLTKIPADLDQKVIKLPFRSLYIDAEFPINTRTHKGKIAGILINEHEMAKGSIPFCTKHGSVNIPNIDIAKLGEEDFTLPCGCPSTNIDTFETKLGRGLYVHYVFLEESNDYRWMRNTMLIVEHKTKDKPRIAPHLVPIRDFIYNFVLFLNEPDVQIKEIIRTEKNRERAIKKGKFPMPSTKDITLTGTLLKYVGDLQSKGAFQYSHKFWVRGHWRTLRDPRYGEKVGTRQWIAPFIKGKGILIDKKYRLEKEADR